MTNDRRYSDVLINLEAALEDLETLNTERGTGPNYTRKFDEEIEDLKGVIGYVKMTKPKNPKTEPQDDDDEEDTEHVHPDVTVNRRLDRLEIDVGHVRKVAEGFDGRMGRMEELIVGLVARVGHAARQKLKRSPSKKK